MSEAAKLRTPQKLVGGLGSAHDGTRHYIAMAASAMVLVPLSLWAIWFALALVHADFAHARALVRQPIVAVPLIAFVIVALWHAKLGVQIILEDYVHGHALQFTVQVLLRFATAIVALACVLAILRVALG